MDLEKLGAFSEEKHLIKNAKLYGFMLPVFRSPILLMFLPRSLTLQESKDTSAE